METTQLNDPAELLDMVIGDLETELPPTSAAATTCHRLMYCI